MFEFITKRPLWVNLIAGFILMVVLLFLLSITLGPLTRHGKNRTVPYVVGMSFDEAKSKLRSEGFDFEIQDSIYIDTTAKGAVLKQFPEGDAVVKISRTVYLTINRFVPPVVEMPNLIGFSFRSAEMQLKNMGLKIGDTIYVPDFAKNSVKEQLYKGSPIAPGTKIQQGTAIDIKLSNGVGNVEFSVPNLVGMTFGEAKSLLEDNGLIIGAVVAPGITDSLSAFIIDQRPKRYDDEGRKIKIRAGQLMNIWLGTERPAADSLIQNQ